MLEVAARHRFGDFQLDAGFRSDSGLTALFGRSGSGKSSLISIIAGLVRPQQGRIVLDGRVLLDTAEGVFVPAHRRRIGYVFQEGRLFPHLTVRQNLLYGRWFTPAAERSGRLDDIVALLGIGALLGRRPALLSGGEKQRVAIGRALLASPRLLLMDEPLASLDEARKSEVLPYIETLRDEKRIPIVYVSHSLAEVARLATTLVLVADGRVAAAGPVAEIMSRLDLQPLAGRIDAGAVLDTSVAGHDAAFDLTILQSAAGELRVPRLDLAPGSPLRVLIRARDVMIALQRPQGLSALNVLPATIADIGPTGGPVVALRLDCGGAPLVARLTRQSVQALGLTRGGAVFAVIKSIAFDRRSIGLGPLPDDEADTTTVIGDR